MNKEHIFWLLAAGFALLILATAPFVMDLSNWFKERNLLLLLLASLLIGFFLFLTAYMILHSKIRGTGAFLSILFLLVLSLLVIVKTPILEEQIHLLEYGILTLLFFKACRFRFRGFLLFGLPLFLSVSIGWIDELWQSFLPSRVFGIDDVVRNTIAAFIGIGFGAIRERYGIIDKSKGPSARGGGPFESL